ncbi:hypothetical protein BV20DRAFT_969795 [Pilatotrama ljubarskyi]|nr:hypothetical protein BV20DRAFT_969795 [Pilatotrama ljubarskyi]
MSRPAWHLPVFLFCLSTLLFVVFQRALGGGGDEVSRPQSRNYTYIGHDYPSSWELPPLAQVHLSQENTVQYALETDLGVAEWNATLPSGGTLLHLGPHFRPFTLSMFHQLRCLDIIRDIIVDFYMDTSPDAQFKRPDLAQHCMNYLRQTVMCRADLRLEHVRASSGSGLTVPDVTHTCADWTAVYEAAEQNYQEYLAHASGRRR